MEKNTILDPELTIIGKDCIVKEGAIIHPFSVINNSTIEEDAVIMPFSYIENSCIKRGAKVFASVIENSVVEENATIGPLSHIRPNSIVGSGVRIGNFVEIKNSVIKKNSKVSHLSYVGDADVGENVNVGCGVVFVNYDGRRKHRTRVGNGAFIGSSVNLIAPVSVGDNAFICAGTTIDKDVSCESFVIGRSRMVEKLCRAKDYKKPPEKV